MKKYIRFFLLLTVLLAIFIFLSLLGYQTRQTAENPHGTIGNTAGNLNNSGLFCEYNGTVYFANPADGYSLYTMTSDEQDIQKITNAQICNILAGGEHIYYFQKSSHDESMGNVRISHGFFRCDLDGSHSVTMTTETIVLAQMVNSHLYMLAAKDEGPVFYKMKIDKSDKVALANYHVNPVCVRGGIIYYTGNVNDHHLYTLNSMTDVSNELLTGNIWLPVTDENYVYFLDADKNYRLCRYSIEADTIEIMTEDRVDCYNIGNGYIYYQCNSQTEPALKMMRTDGTGLTTLAYGNYTHINMTSKYVYFQEFGEENSLYHSLIGDTSYSSMWSNP